RRRLRREARDRCPDRLAVRSDSRSPRTSTALPPRRRARSKHVLPAYDERVVAKTGGRAARRTTERVVVVIVLHHEARVIDLARGIEHPRAVRRILRDRHRALLPPIIGVGIVRVIAHGYLGVSRELLRNSRLPPYLAERASGGDRIGGHDASVQIVS